MTETEVQKCTIAYLSAKGWSHKLVSKGLREHGADIVVRDNNNKNKARYLFVECKCESQAKSAKSMTETVWLYALGQLVIRMKVIAKNAYIYGLGLPEASAKIALRRIPWKVAQHLSLRIYSVNNLGQVQEYTPKHFRGIQEKIKAYKPVKK